MTAEVGTSVRLQSHCRGDAVLQSAACEPRVDPRLQACCRGVYLVDAMLLSTMLKPPSHTRLDRVRCIACGIGALPADVPGSHKACGWWCWVASRK